MYFPLTLSDTQSRNKSINTDTVRTWQSLHRPSQKESRLPPLAIRFTTTARLVALVCGSRRAAPRALCSITDSTAKSAATPSALSPSSRLKQLGDRESVRQGPELGR